MGWQERWNQLWRREAHDDELAEEMRLHLEMKEEELRAAGLTEREAHGAARRAFGNQLQFAEQSRRHWLPAWLDEVGQDTRFALRSFGRSRGFVATVVLTMALGIGANTAIFSLVEAVLLRRLPVAEPERLMEVNAKYREPGRWTSSGDDSWNLSYPLLQEVSAAQRSFSCLYGRATGLQSYAESGEGPWDTRPRLHFVSTCFFDTIGVAPLLGRGLLPRDVPGGKAQPVVVLSHGLWQRRFSSDPGVIGRKLTVGAVVVEIVGVMPPGFVGDTPSQPADLWLPLELFGAVSNWGSWNERGNTWFDVMGRLRPGVRPEQAQAELTGVLRNCVRTDLEEWRSSGSTVRSTPEMFRVELAAGSGGFNELRRRYDKALWLLSGAVALLLLLACLNVAGLLLARGVARSREMGVRLALGASRARVMRQLLLESLLLCAGGAVIGLAIANWFAGYFVTMVSRVTQPLDVPYRLNGTVLGFTLAVTALAALVSGFLPAWQTTRSHLSAQLSAAARSVTQHRSRLVWNRGLVAAQVALGVLLACGAGLMLRSLHTLTSRDVGYRVDGLAVAFLEPAPRKESTDLRFHFEQQSARIEQFRQRLLALPGVQSAALAHMSPMSGWMMSATMNTPSGGTGRIMAMQNYVSLGYFETLDTKLKAGRWFHSSDRGAGRRVCVIDEDLARALFADRSPLGQRISSGQKYDAENSMEVIGVARPNKWYGPKQSGLPFKGMVWTTLEQSKRPFLVVMARTAGDATGLAPALKTVFREEMPEMLVTATTTMEELRDATLQQERMMTVLLSLFGVVALVIVFAGQHGLLAYTVERRVPELGIRVALGATARDLLSMVGKESLLLIGAGLLVGLPAAAGLSRLLTAYLFEVKPTDPWSYGLTAALVGAIGVLAAVRPARRAASVEAASALRGE